MASYTDFLTLPAFNVVDTAMLTAENPPPPVTSPVVTIARSNDGRGSPVGLSFRRVPSRDEACGFPRRVPHVTGRRRRDGTGSQPVR